MNRRRFIFGSLAVLLGASTGLTVYQYQQSEGSDDSRDLVLDALLPAVLSGALPAEPTQAQQQLHQTKQAVIDYLAFLPNHQQQQLQQLFLALDLQISRLALTGHWLRLTDWPLDQRLVLLQSWRDSYLDLMQQAYAGCKELLLGAYYGDPDHWHALHYRALQINPQDQT